MEEKSPFRYGPTRGELWFWLGLSAAGLCFLAYAVLLRGLPSGPALIEVVGLAGLLFGYLGGRSIKRLVLRQHP
jgi:xanthosine utilization system XapX-like protein